MTNVAHYSHHIKKNTTWQEGFEGLEPYAMLRENIATDVVVVGAGIAGTLTAYLLANSGHRVVLIDKGSLIHTVTAYTTAMITYEIDTALVDLEKMYGRAAARDVWKSGKEAIDELEDIIAREKIECEFVRVPEFVFANDEGEMKEIHQDLVLGKKLGFKIYERQKDALNFRNAGSMELKDQAKFHPIKFLAELRKRAIQKGVQIFEHTEAVEIEGERPVTVVTKHGNVVANWVVIATYQPFKNPAELFAHKGMYYSYMFEVELAKGTIAEGLYLDNANPYHYFRVDDLGRVDSRTGKEITYDRMLIGGEDHRKEIHMNPEKNYAALEDYLKSLVGEGKYKIVRRWNGPILEPVDGLPFIGVYTKKHPNRLVATAFSGNGMQFSMVAARLITDHIDGINNPYAALYDAGRRLKLASLITKGRDFTGELFGGAGRNIFHKLPERGKRFENYK